MHTQNEHSVSKPPDPYIPSGWYPPDPYIRRMNIQSAIRLTPVAINKYSVSNPPTLYIRRMNILLVGHLTTTIVKLYLIGIRLTATYAERIFARSSASLYTIGLYIISDIRRRRL